MTPRLVGIAGGTAAGKTTLVGTLARRFPASVVLDLDSYYFDRSGVDREARGRINFDEPAAIEVGLLVEHLRQLAAGEPVPKPRYSFEHHTRTGFEVVRPAPLVLVEGLFALFWQEVRGLLDLRVFVDAPADLRLARRIQRDVAERGRSVESVLSQYLETVRPMHARYVEPTRWLADVVVTGVGPVEQWAGRVVSAVDGLLDGAEVGVAPA